MNRKFKLYFSLASLCFSVAMLCFGVYSAMSVSYTVNGSVSYEVTDVFVDIETSLYMSTLSTLTKDDELKSNVSSIYEGLKGTGVNTQNIAKSTEYGTSEYSSYTQEGGFDKTEKPTSKSLPIRYGSYIENDSAYAYYIAIKVTNKAENTIYAVLDLNLDEVSESQLNSIIDANQTTIELQGNTTEYIVVGMALDDATTGVSGQEFNWTLNVSKDMALPYFVDGPSFSATKQQSVSMALYDSQEYVDISKTPLQYTIPDDEKYFSDVMGIYIATSKVKFPQGQDYLNTYVNVASSTSIMGVLVLDGTNYTAQGIADILSSYDPSVGNDALLHVPGEGEGPIIRFDRAPKSEGVTIGIASVSEVGTVEYSLATPPSGLFTEKSYFDVSLSQTISFNSFTGEYMSQLGDYGYVNYSIKNIPNDVRYLVVKGNEIFALSSAAIGNGILILPGKIVDGVYTYKNLSYDIDNFSNFLVFFVYNYSMFLGLTNESYLDLAYAENGEMEFCCLYCLCPDSPYYSQMKDNGGQLTFDTTFYFSKDNSEFIYDLKDDNTYEIRGLKTLYFECVDGNPFYHPYTIKIPETYNGKQVTSIKAGAFSGFDMVTASATSFFLSETIVEIGHNAFFDAGVSSLYLNGQKTVDGIQDALGVSSGGTYDMIVPNLYIKEGLTPPQSLLEYYTKADAEYELDGVTYYLYQYINTNP